MDPFRWFTIAILFGAGVQLGRIWFSPSMRQRLAPALILLAVALGMASQLGEPPRSARYPLLAVQSALLLAGIVIYARSGIQKQAAGQKS
jgi:hypothetical protein